MIDISFIILTWNSKSHIKRCLDSIFHAFEENKYRYEIYIVDNGSTDGTRPIIEGYKKLYPNILNPIFLDRNMGTTYSRNIAIRQSKGEFLVIMDSDVEIFKETIEILLLELQRDKTIAMAAPKLVYEDGSLQKSIDKFPTIWTKLYRYFFLKLIEKRENKTIKGLTPFKIDYAISALWVIRKDMIEQIGLLDENIFYSPEDVDYCIRIWKKGYKIVYVPESCAIHHGQEISRKSKINWATIEHIKGLFYLFYKHKYFFRRPIFY